MGNHRADVTNDAQRSVTPSPGATTSSSSYVGKRRAAPATDSPASRPAPRATGSTSYVGKRRAAPSPAVGTATPTPAPETPEEPVAKARPNRVVLEQTGTLPVVGSPRGDASLDREATDGRISTGELRALVEGDGGSSFPASFPTTPPAAPASRPIVPVQRRAAQIDPVLADLLSSMGIDPDKVTPEVLEDLGVGGMTTSELTMFLTQPTKAAPAKAAASKAVSTKTPPRGVPAAQAAPAPAVPEPVAPVAPVAPIAPVVPEPTFEAPEPTWRSEPAETHTPKPLRMANTFAPLTGKIRAVREARQAPAAQVTPPPAPAYEHEVKEPRGFQEAFDAPPTSFKIDTTSFPAPPVALPQQIDFDSMAIDLPVETYAADAPYYEAPQAEEAFYQDDYAGYDHESHQPESYFRADTGSIDLPSISEIATYRPELDLPAVETTGTMVGIGGPTRPRTRRAAAAAAGGRPTVPLTAGAAALAAAIGGIALTGGPTLVAADDVRLVGATALGGDSDMVVVGDRSATVTRNDERTEADTAASDREKALQGVDVQADKQDKFLKSNMWELPIAAGVYRITGTFGSSGSNWSSTHTGLDFAAPYGTPIHAIARGTVTETGWGGAYGERTIITLEDGTEIWYCHQSDYGVSVGDTVSPGDVIGYVGSTGNSTGNHLHVEVRPGGGDAVDPDAALNEHGVDPS